MSSMLPLFKTWVPVWLIRLTILMIVLPPLMLLGLYYSNVTETAGYYGMEPGDVQFSVLLFYSGLAAYFPLEKRFLNYWATKHYLLLNIALLTLTYYFCWLTRSTPLFMVIRLVQGFLCGAIGGIGLTLVFANLASERARAMGYTIYYGMLLCAGPLSGILAAWVLSNYEFRVLFEFMIYLQLPGVLLLLLIMNNVSHKRMVPLYQLEWPSFVFYTLGLCLVGYVMVYGQRDYWLEDPFIAGSLALALLSAVLFALRQKSLKRPFINLDVFKYRNFILGLLLLVPFYIFRGTLGVTTSIFSMVLELDPLHISSLLLLNMLGLIVGMIVTVRYMLQGASVRWLWLTGFALFLVFHVWMCLLFDTEVEAIDFVGPLLIQGLATGVLMVPIVVFTVSAVPAALSGAASSLGIASRYLGYSLSIAVINFFQLFEKKTHLDSLQREITQLNPYATERLGLYQRSLLNAGADREQSGRMAVKLLRNTMDTQSQLRFAMDYYTLVAWGILLLLLLIAAIPHWQGAAVHFRRKPLPN